MAGKVVNSSFWFLSKFVASRQVNASKTATSHIRKTLPPIIWRQCALKLTARNKQKTDTTK